MVRGLLQKGLIVEALEALETEAQAFTGEGFEERVRQCRTEFGYMSDFMMKGYQDPRRGELYADLTRRIGNIWYDLRVRRDIRAGSAYDPYRKVLYSIDFPDDTLRTMLMDHRLRCPEDKKYHDVIKTAFSLLYGSYHWRGQDMEEWVEHITDPDIPYVEAAVITSAISMSCFVVFSREKARCLAEVYRRIPGDAAVADTPMQPSPAALRQRAFVGCVLALCHAEPCHAEEVEEVLDVLFQCPDAAKDLTELQMQMATCADTDRNSSEIRNKLMPDIIKNQPFRFTTKGIEEREEEDDMLDPGASDRRMEVMERSIRRMLKMQKEGVDIFFESFSQMKRFPFFYMLSNWFVPFYMEQHDIKAYVDKIEDRKYIDMVTQRGPFCDSDKYSFVISMSSILKDMPENMREMFNSGQIGPIGMRKEGESGGDPSLLRLHYLQDLYRYFRLTPFTPKPANPFDETALCKPWTITARRFGRKELYDICTYLIRKGSDESMKHAVPQLLNAFDDKECLERTFCIAEYRMRRKEHATAAEYYAKCLKMKRDHTAAMRGIAKACYESGDYAKASFYFDALHTLYPDRLSYALNFAMAMVKSGKANEVVNELYRLEFEHPDDETIRNTLGWALLYAGKAGQALALYRRFNLPEADFSVLINHVYALLFTGSMTEAIGTLRANAPRFTIEGGEDFPTLLIRTMQEDDALLAQYGFGKAEQAVILAAMKAKSDINH